MLPSTPPKRCVFLKHNCTKNCTRFACNSRMSVCFLTRARAKKSVTQIIYLGPLPSAKTLQWTARLQTHSKDVLFNLALVTDTSKNHYNFMKRLDHCWWFCRKTQTTRILQRKNSCNFRGRKILLPHLWSIACCCLNFCSGFGRVRWKGDCDGPYA